MAVVVLIKPDSLQVQNNTKTTREWARVVRCVRGFCAAVGKELACKHQAYEPNDPKLAYMRVVYCHLRGNTAAKIILFS